MRVGFRALGRRIQPAEPQFRGAELLLLLRLNSAPTSCVCRAGFAARCLLLTAVVSAIPAWRSPCSRCRAVSPLRRSLCLCCRAGVVLGSVVFVVRSCRADAASVCARLARGGSGVLEIRRWVCSCASVGACENTQRCTSRVRPNASPKSG